MDNGGNEMTRDEIKAIRDQYLEANATHSRAFAAYEVIRKQYHNREIGDNEFLAARAVYQLTLDSLDAIATYIEQNDINLDDADAPIEEEAPVAEQLELF